MTKYDDKINDAWGKQVTGPYERGERDLDACIAAFKEAVAAAYTDITVE